MFHCHCPSPTVPLPGAFSPPGVLHQELSAAGRVLLIDPLSCRSSKVDPADFHCQVFGSIYRMQGPSGKRLHNYGKIHHF